MEGGQQRHANEGDAEQGSERDAVLTDREDRHVLCVGRLELASLAIKHNELLGLRYVR